MMAGSSSEAAQTLRRLKARSQSATLRDTNKRPRVASVGERETQHKKTETATSSPGPSAYASHQRTQAETKSAFPTDVEDEGGGRDVTDEIAAIAAKNEQLQVSVASLKRKFSLREEETHQLLLGLGALNAVANELTALQKDYQERSTKNAALIQESLAQISNCSAQVDTLKRCRGLTATQLQNFRQECTQEINRLVTRLGGLAESACREPELFDGDDVSCSDVRMLESRQQVQQLKDDVIEYRAQLIEDGSVGSAPSCKSTSGPTQQNTTERINIAIAQLDELHAEMFQLKQNLVQENQSFRRHLEELVSQQMTHVRDVQDNETERIHEEMDEIWTGMCGILKDVHRLKERTKYLVPSMARVGPRMPRSNANGPPPLQPRMFGMGSGDQNEERRAGAPISNPHSTGYSMTMAAGQCQDEYPHYEHGFDDDCYCPGVLPSQLEVRYPLPGHPRSSRSSNSSAGRSDDEHWQISPPEDAPATDLRVAQRCESPHFSSRSSSLPDRLSVYGEEHVVPNDEPGAEQFEQQLLEQHRLFWIGEGAG